MCEHGLQLIAHAIGRLNARNPKWSTLRVGYGMNGILLQCKDLQATIDYLYAEQIMMPVDLLTDEWHMRSTHKGQAHFPTDRKAYFFRFNLLYHIGSVSTFQGRAERESIACGAPLQLPNSFVPGTGFDSSMCSADDISPCDSGMEDTERHFAAIFVAKPMIGFERWHYLWLYFDRLTHHIHFPSTNFELWECKIWNIHVWCADVHEQKFQHLGAKIYKERAGDALCGLIWPASDEVSWLWEPSDVTDTPIFQVSELVHRLNNW